jgi:hypothetical protein
MKSPNKSSTLLDIFDSFIFQEKVSVECRTAWCVFAADHQINVYAV